MSAQKGGGRIQTSNLRFIRRGPIRLNYILKTQLIYIKIIENL